MFLQIKKEGLYLHLSLKWVFFPRLRSFFFEQRTQILNKQDVCLFYLSSTSENHHFQVINMAQMRFQFIEKIVKVLLQRRGRCSLYLNSQYFSLLEGLKRVYATGIKYAMNPNLQQIRQIALTLSFSSSQMQVTINFSSSTLPQQLSHFTLVHSYQNTMLKIAVNAEMKSTFSKNLVRKMRSMFLILIPVTYIIYTTTIMLGLLRRSIALLSSNGVRRQNFFELNPIYPDEGQKDFDIYNIEYKHVQGGLLAVSDEERYQKLKQKLTQEIFLRPVRERNYDPKKGDYELDEETGFPLGIHEDFDDFIEIFKRQKKVGDDVFGEFQALTMSLMRKFEAKSELELIKIFRFNLATLRKNNLRDRLRALLINSAFMRFVKQRKAAGISNDSLSLTDIQPFLDNPQSTLKKEGSQISKKELEEAAFRSILKQFDNKIATVEQEVHKKALADRTFVPSFHPKYGPAIKQNTNYNLGHDLNFGRGFPAQVESTVSGYTPQETQERYIEKRINQLFFMRALQQIQKKQKLTVQNVINTYDLPLNIRNKDKIINSILHKYKEYDLLIEPDLEDIYAEIDIALKKVSVSVVPNLVQNQLENQRNENGQVSGSSTVKQRIISKEVLLWSKLDVEEIFDPEHYDQDEVDAVKLAQKQLIELSPSVTMQLSLNKMPMNLYRHADLDNFGVFNKYRRRIYKDYITDRTIDPEIQFKFFSLEQAKNTLKKVKKPTQVPDRYYGYGKRKSTEAEVYITKGTGKVLINNQPLADYFGDVYHRGETLKPLIYTQTAGQFDLEFTVVGGGVHSQAECMSIALTNALIMVDPSYKSILDKTGLVGIDDRKKEAKKIGLYSARVRPPYVRR